jgi:hypothetical protein
MLKIPFDEIVLYKKVLSKEELKEASREMTKLRGESKGKSKLKKGSKGKSKGLIVVVLSIIALLFAILPVLETWEILGEGLESIILLIASMAALPNIFISFKAPLLPREYAFGNNAVYFGRNRISWVKLEQRNIAIKPAEQGLLLEPEKWWRREIFVFTKEVKAVEGIIKTHLRVRQ